jgi:hypothetical protein
MIGQYLSNTNEKTTVSILQNILELNKTHVLASGPPGQIHDRRLTTNDPVRSPEMRRVLISRACPCVVDQCADVIEDNAMA